MSDAREQTPTQWPGMLSIGVLISRYRDHLRGRHDAQEDYRSDCVACDRDRLQFEADQTTSASATNGEPAKPRSRILSSLFVACAAVGMWSASGRPVLHLIDLGPWEPLVDIAGFWTCFWITIRLERRLR